MAGMSRAATLSRRVRQWQHHEIRRQSPGQSIHNVAAAEAMALGMKAGLDPSVLYDTLADSAGTSRMFEVRGPLMRDAQYEQATATIRTHLKDVDIINAFADRLRCPTPLFAGRGATLLCSCRARFRDAGYRRGLRGYGGLGRPGSPLSAGLASDACVLTLRSRAAVDIFSRICLRDHGKVFLGVRSEQPLLRHPQQRKFRAGIAEFEFEQRIVESTSERLRCRLESRADAPAPPRRADPRIGRVSAY